MIRYFLKRKKRAIAPTSTPTMLAPESLMEVTRGTRKNLFIWYKAMWKVQQEPDINPFQLATYLGISWKTAGEMKQKLDKYLQ